MRLMRLQYGDDLNPTSLFLMRGEPVGYAQRYETYFRCPIHFADTAIRFEFDASVIDMPLQNASPELAQMNDQNVARYLTKLDRSDIVNQVRCVIVDNIGSQNITKQHVADKLFMSTRSLQNKLAARSTSFQEILDSTRKTLAISYMNAKNITITEMAYLLGFTDVSNFTRAFRRWTGVSPSSFRTFNTLEASAKVERPRPLGNA
jgi:AraC-like DNA-binding protein